jgi:hypothetical protein
MTTSGPDTIDRLEGCPACSWMFIFEMTSGRPSLSFAQQWRGGAESDPSAAGATFSGFVASSPPAKQRFKAPVGWHHAVWPRRRCFASLCSR